MTATASRPPLLALLSGAFYLVLTLLPDSSTAVLSWPWVLIWQVGLFCPVFWLLTEVGRSRRWVWLGQGWDWLVGGGILGLGLAAMTAVYPHQARWYTIAAFCGLATLYALNHWLNATDLPGSDLTEKQARRDRLLTGQGYLGIAFVVVSLGLWATQTWLPELQRLQQIQQQFGVSLPFTFGTLQNRNWAPIGHQNYVAGYLTLILPLFAGLGLTQHHRRWLWGGAVGLGLLDLYTTTSRAGWVGLMVAAIAVLSPFLLGKAKMALSRQTLVGATLGGLGAIGLLLYSTGRIQALLRGTSVGALPGELLFRLINITAGGAMGWQRPLTGQGLGSVPLLYQSFRPMWAGREAELVFQLHSTPLQLWAELGVIGVALGLGIAALLMRTWWQHRDRLSCLTHSLFVALLAYMVQGLADYQLDLICISGLIIVLLAAIAAELQTLHSGNTSRIVSVARPIPAIGVGLLLAVILMVLPFHRAWMLSNQGFLALAQVESAKTPDDRNRMLNQFVQSLTQAHQIAPWEPYYPYQLGWVLGDMGLKQSDRSLIDSALQWFKTGNQIVPTQEFGQSNLGWLLLNTDPKAAQAAFQQAARLIPAKPGVFYGLGMSLLYQNRVDLGINAIAIDMVRDPTLITSPQWQTPQQKTLYEQLLRRTEAIYGELIDRAPNPIFMRYLRACRSGLRWWMGNMSAAREDANAVQDPLLTAILDLQDGKSVNWQALPEDASKYAIAAWLNPTERDRYLHQAWIQAQGAAPPREVMAELRATMDRSKTLTEWLRQNAVANSNRKLRLGFNVLSRHTDGINPKDFLNEVNNVPMTVFFSTIMQSMIYFPELDQGLQELRSSLLQSIT
ncbi:MAG: O-antigen ligase family protein [Synechococcales bacterium]|nr:O-antigen ligase family protein [Synechococcales bacterium]